MTRSNIIKGNPITFKMRTFDELQCSAGAANRKDMKSCYLQIKGTMKSQIEEHKLASRRFIHRVKQVVNSSLKGSNFKDKFLIDPMIKDSFVWTGECFFTIELTFFGIKELNRVDAAKEMNRIATDIFNHAIRQEKNLEFMKYVRSKKLLYGKERKRTQEESQSQK